MGCKKKDTISRRQFIADTSIAAVGSTLLMGSTASLFSGSKEKEESTVVLIRNKDVLDSGGNPVYDVVLQMLDKAVIELTGKKDPVEGWKIFIRPDDIVGIKSNVWKPINTTSQVEQAIKKRVMDAGVRETNIAISDRRVLRLPVFKKATALINARPMRSHHWSGVGSLIKNYVMFVPDPYNYHSDACADLGKIWLMPHVKDKTRLNVLVMFTPQFHNIGPHGFSPRHVWKYYGLIVGFDPVAIDTVGVRIIQEQRQIYFKEERPLNPSPKHIVMADTRYHLGISDLKRIKIVRFGYDKDTLI